MSRRKKPARLWFRKDTGTWFIKDGGDRIPTGCDKSEIERAERALEEYRAKKYRPSFGSRADEVAIGDALLVYLENKTPHLSRPREEQARILRLADFFHGHFISEIKGQICREYAEARGHQAGARRDLETLRSAINYYHAEHTLDRVPKVTLPMKSLPRERALTRSEVAALIREARKFWNHKHLVRLIMLGVYTGSRLGVITSLQWMPNTTGGYVDLDRGVIHRKAQGERVAHNKRKPPMKIPPRLLRFLRYWHRADNGQGYVFRYKGDMVRKPHKSFRALREAAGLGPDVTPHVMRHTRATWLAHAGVDINMAAESLGMTAEEFERTYSHANPDFQSAAANAY